MISLSYILKRCFKNDLKNKYGGNIWGCYPPFRIAVSLFVVYVTIQFLNHALKTVI